ncbi:RDD family protein [Actinokineospora bangkokensis]|uniref:RDD domain-containing protein n=1 Tax=Actinokineospora bangkokensis TaxID=1193682 RepID=A0A1Q9LE00_9PSEU|nr:RDD family protein [Actinokineospora bangkokensis]OLR90219.1 hypothetical protein BJP25_04490 [Actinokineospora bangkokensis]
MSRWTGSWLPGSGDEVSAQRWPGERMGLPERGEGSVASGGVRFLALVVDLVLASLATSIAIPFDFDDPAAMWTRNLWAGAVWLLITVAGVGLAGFTPGKALLGMRVVRIDGQPIVGPVRALGRAVLTGILVPAAIVDKDGRGLHDRFVGTVELRTR